MKQFDFEESMKKLEEIVKALEKGELSLEESLSKFEEGLALGKRCRELLETAEARIKKVVRNSDGSIEERDCSDEF